ncbi:hypothetical protein D9757_006530 [Collybiopsis confluens]|uniref:Uncharacterized protein n=1 Tax=Collybiopsis confluens TaxID=2823264 RepID=A0A8H5HQB9_9AGAR|nr:hypothetical protein D9757_006530 [Collybiopsis confluens]
MGSSSKHKKHEKEKSSKKRHRHDEERSEKRHKRKRTEDVTDAAHAANDEDDDDMWVEKNTEVKDVSNESMYMPPPPPLAPPEPSASSGNSGLKRDEWMLGPSSSSALGSSDFFSALGTEVPRRGKEKELEKTREMEKAAEIERGAREIQVDDSSVAEPRESQPPLKQTNTPGGPGSHWRMTRLKRVYEAAEEEGRDVLEVALERFVSVEAWEEVVEERRILDERDGRNRGRQQNRYGDGGPKATGGGGERGFMFSNSVTSSRSSSFRRPGGSAPSTPSPSTPSLPPANRRLDSLRLPSQANSPLQQSHTPIPSVMTPPRAIPSGSSTKRALSPSSLNKLQAKVLRAKLVGAPNATELEKEYEAAQRFSNGHHDDESESSSSSGVRHNIKVEALPTLDARGRLYDIGSSVRRKEEGEDDSEAPAPGNRKKRKEMHFDTHDPKTHELVRYNADDDSTTLSEMLRQEKFGAGMADQKDQDMAFARAIMGDGKFENDLDYIDDNAAKLGRQKMRTDAMKRQFAVHDYKRTQQAFANCDFCFQSTTSGPDADETPPRAPIIAMGTRVYLSCTTYEELVPGHCLIVPIQHCLTMLEGDDDVWDEVRNFMKTLMRMFSEQEPSRGVVFYETVTPGSMKGQRHSYIECVPVEWEIYDVLGGYFKESILSSGSEWSTNRKLIDFSSRAGGFRRSMVPNLPYFMVQFDYKGEKGFGHVIESDSSGGGNKMNRGKDKVGFGMGGGDGDGDNDDILGMEGTGEKSGGEFPRYFAAEIIGNVLELEPRRWRRSRRILGGAKDRERIKAFRKWYDKYDWTGMIGQE